MVNYNVSETKYATKEPQSQKGNFISEQENDVQKSLLTP